jgi:hypothetical protein
VTAVVAHAVGSSYGASTELPVAGLVRDAFLFNPEFLQEPAAPNHGIPVLFGLFDFNLLRQFSLLIA